MSKFYTKKGHFIKNYREYWEKYRNFYEKIASKTAYVQDIWHSSLQNRTLHIRYFSFRKSTEFCGHRVLKLFQGMSFAIFNQLFTHQHHIRKTAQKNHILPRNGMKM